MKILLSIILFLLSFAEAQALTMGEAINQAGRQRMLSQRIVKDYILVGRYRKLDAKVELKQSIDLFEKQLKALERFAKTAEEKETIKEIKKIWKPYRQIASSKPKREEVEKLEILSEELLDRSHHLVELLETRSGTSLGRLVNLSGRQRMLTQRIAKYYLLKSWGFRKPEYDNYLEIAISEFNNALRALMAAPENTPKISAELSQVQKYWNAFNISGRLGEDQFIPSLVTRALDKILQKMDKITKMYAQLHLLKEL